MGGNPPINRFICPHFHPDGAVYRRKLARKSARVLVVRAGCGTLGHPEPAGRSRAGWDFIGRI